MTVSVQEAVGPIISAGSGDERLLNYVDGLDGPLVGAAREPPLHSTELEAIQIQRNAAGHILLATTIKLPNLRFRLGDLLLDAAGTAVAAAGTLDHPLPLLLTGLRFLRTLRQLARIEIGEEDAQMLLAICRLAQEETRVRVDDLPTLLLAAWSDAQIARSLERLESLACIELRMEGILLNETIIVQQLD